MNLFVFGLGYTALHLIRRHRDRFGCVAGTVRSAEKAQALAQEGIAARLFAPGHLDPAIGDDLGRADLLLVSIAPGETGDPVLSAYGQAIASAARPAWIGYLSTIGVYGDHGGAWIDETTPASPTTARARSRVAAEAGWLALAEEAGKAACVLRLGGIYGPGRNALADLKAGTARRIVKPGQVFNRTHVDDIAAAVLASAGRPDGPRLVNVTDDEPAPAQDVVAYAASLAGVAPPPEIAFETAELSPMAKSFYGNNRRVSNARLRGDLGVKLAYPTYREGLHALRQAGEGP